MEANSQAVMMRVRRAGTSVNSQSKVKSGPSVFYILAVT